MDIVITAVQGRGKTLLAERIASLFAPKHHVIEIEYDHAELRYDRMVRDARADVVIVEALPDYHLADAQLAMQIARDELHKSFIAIYCVQAVVGGESGKTPWLPGGFVNNDGADAGLLHGPIYSHPDPVINKRVRELRADGETVYVKKAPGFPNGITDDMVDQVNEQLYGDNTVVREVVDVSEVKKTGDDPLTFAGEIYVKETRTLDILQQLYRDCAEVPQALIEAQRIVGTFDPERSLIANIDPTFYPALHDQLRPVADWARCDWAVRKLAKAGKSSEVRHIFRTLGDYPRLSKIPFARGTTLLQKLKDIE